MKFFLPVFVCKFLKCIAALVKATINTSNRITIFLFQEKLEKWWLLEIKMCRFMVFRER